MIKAENPISQKQVVYVSTTRCLKVLEHLIPFNYNMRLNYAEEVQYNCSAHPSVHLFIIVISSHSHVRQKQQKRTFLQYSCSATIINIVKKYLWRKIHELNTWSVFLWFLATSTKCKKLTAALLLRVQERLIFYCHMLF